MYKPEVALKVVDQFIEELVKFLDQNGQEVKSQKIKGILENLQRLTVLNPNKEYFSLILDKNGYIKGYNIMDTIIENKDLPEDLEKGYYRLDKNNKPVLDKKRRKELWGD